MNKKLKDIKICIFGATGLVGDMIAELLDDQYNKAGHGDKLSAENVTLVASDHSVETQKEPPSFWLRLTDQLRLIKAIDALAMKPDIVLMSAGEDASKEWAKQFTDVGSFVIDNSSAWRMDIDVPLVVSGVSDWTPNNEQKLIANPNCVAIMVATALAPLVSFDMSVVAVTALQSVSGAGQKGLDALRNQEKNGRQYVSGISGPFSDQVYNNIIPASLKVFSPETKYNLEEEKAMVELQKILGFPLRSSFRSFRVPVQYGHTAAIRIKFKGKVALPEIEQALSKGSNIIYTPYPVSLREVVEKDYCFVWGLRHDLMNEKVIEFVTMSDNIRLGAASNAVSIASKIIESGIL